MGIGRILKMRIELHSNKETLSLSPDTLKEAFMLGEIYKSNTDVSIINYEDDSIELTIRLSRLLEIASNSKE